MASHECGGSRLRVLVVAAGCAGAIAACAGAPRSDAAADVSVDAVRTSDEGPALDEAVVIDALDASADVAPAPNDALDEPPSIDAQNDIAPTHDDGAATPDGAGPDAHDAAPEAELPPAMGVCSPGERRSCYGGPEATRGVGVCRDGEQQCALDASGVAAWTRCEGEVRPYAADDVRCDGLDHACRGEAPPACRCLLGQSRSCYSGPEGTEGRGVCRAGTQRCVIGSAGRAEFGPCEGEVGPAAGDACGNERDDDCDGETDEGCGCDGPVACYTGPSSTRRRGSCRDGAYQCVTDASGRRSLDTSACVGQVLPRPPAACFPVRCRNADDDCDGLPDCIVDCFRNTWEVFRTPAPVCYGITYAACGTRNEFTFAPPIPPSDDPGWVATPDRQINFGTSPSSRDRRSRLVGGACTCRNGGDFTFFQTTFTVGENPLRPGFADASSFSIDIARFNNAVRATLFNARAPFGVDFLAFDAPSSACDAAPLGPVSSRVDPAIMADRLAPGVNRLVLTLLDDCAGERELTGVDLHIDGRLVNACDPDPADPSCRE